MRYWEQRNDKYYFIGSDADWGTWCREWLETVPKCRDFACIHELMRCGIDIACGDCSIPETVRAGCSGICDGVSCIDCVHVQGCKQQGRYEPKPGVKQ